MEIFRLKIVGSGAECARPFEFMEKEVGEHMLTSYYDLYTLKDYEVRVSDIKEAYVAVRNSTFYEQSKAHLKNQINRMKQKEKQMFKMLKVNNIDEFNDRIKEYKSAVINFSGPRLEEEIIGVLTAKNAAEYEAFNRAVRTVVNKEILEDESIIDYKQYKQNIMDYLNRTFEEKGFKRKGTTQFHSQKGITTEGLFPSSFTEEQKRHWKTILCNDPNLRNYPDVVNYITVTSSSNNTNNVTISFNWFDTIKNMKLTEAKEYNALNPQGIDLINDTIKQKIIGMTNGTDKALIEEIINYMLNKNRYLFFTGRSTNDIIGIFGEITGLFYLSKFLGGLNAALEWKGGIIEKNNGKKPHQDILLHDLFGIQVKNTLDDFVSDVNFTDLNLEKLLERIGPYMPAETKLLIQNYYATLKFNVPYKKLKNGQYVETKTFPKKYTRGQNFLELYKNLQQMEDDVDLLLNLFATTLMYLDASDRGIKGDQNNLFLLGADLFCTASQILINVLEGIELEEARIKIHASITQGKNIIDALNQNNRSKDFSTEFLKQVNIKSSYNFARFAKKN